MTESNQSAVEAFETFEGTDVVDATIAIHKAGDGLSTALQVDARPFHKGEKVYVILETTCDAVSYVDSKRFDGLLARQHKLTTEAAAIVSGQAVAKMLAEAKKEQAEFAAREKERRDAEKGKIKLDGTGLEEVPASPADHGSADD